MQNDLWNDAGFTAVQRAVGDFQAGNPVIVTDDRETRLALSVEALTPRRLFRLREIARNDFALALSPTKARLPRSDFAAVLPLTENESSDRVLDLATRPNIALPRAAVSGDRIDAAIIELAKLCRRLPAAVTLPLTSAHAGEFTEALRVEAKSVLEFRAALAKSLHLVSRAKVALRCDVDSEFIVFRDALGGTWTAVVIGSPDFVKPVAVRLHSSCLTGDSFGSLRCDCGDQLRMSIDILRKAGGILLYLDQEGCGIGLANKMRAYALQDVGLDTIDANMALGFESDERRYDIAARMLALLGIAEVLLLTNNPSKVSGLTDAGIRIRGRVPLIAPVHHENRRYLDAKARRAGHLLDGEGGCIEGASPGS